MSIGAVDKEAIAKWWHLGRSLDSIISNDIVNRGIAHHLYDSAFKKLGSPLTTTAALALQEKVQPGDVVLIATGWPSRSWLMTGITETDGPVGAAFLARILEQCLGVIPIIVTEESLIRFSEVALRAAGLIVTDLDTALKSKCGKSKASVAAVIPFTTEWDESEEKATSLIKNLAVKAVISIEFPGVNAEKQFHNATGRIVPTELVAKIDSIMVAARKSGVLTMAIGDGGNELGMANVADAVIANLANGSEIVPTTPVDYVVIGSVSNFGAAGLAAAVAALEGNAKVIRTVSLTRITERVSDAGAIDGLSAYLDPKNDGVSQVGTEALMELLATTVESHLNGWQKG